MTRQKREPANLASLENHSDIPAFCHVRIVGLLAAGWHAHKSQSSSPTLILCGDRALD